MKMWHLRVVDRETGTETDERVVATDERSAYGIVADRGKVVGGVLAVEELNTKSAFTRPNATSVRNRAQKKTKWDSFTTSIASIAGWLLIVLGLLFSVFGLAMDTTVGSGLVDRSHNIGLLNERLVLVCVGGILMIFGAIPVATVAIIRTIWKQEL